MLSRRGFLLMLGAAFGSTTAGLWLPETGVVTVPRRMVLELTGTCSFCGLRLPAVTALAGVVTRSPRICNQCIDPCLQVFEKEFGAMSLSDAPTPRSLKDLGTAERAAVERAVKDLRHVHADPVPRALHDEDVSGDELRPPVLTNDDPRVVDALRRLRRSSYLVATTSQEQIGAKLAAAHEKAAEGRPDTPRMGQALPWQDRAAYLLVLRRRATRRAQARRRQAGVHLRQLRR